LVVLINSHFGPDISWQMEVPSAEDSNAASPVLALLPEIVTESFFNFLPAHPEFPLYSRFLSPLLLCRIRRHWRGIALTTPALWKAISIVVCDRDTYQTQRVELLKLGSHAREVAPCPSALPARHILQLPPSQSSCGMWSSLYTFLTSTIRLP
jgi:hypothetical protein